MEVKNGEGRSKKVKKVPRYTSLVEDEQGWSRMVKDEQGGLRMAKNDQISSRILEDGHG